MHLVILKGLVLKMLEHIFYYRLSDADGNKIYTCMDYDVIMSMAQAAEELKHEYRLEKIEVLVLKEHDDYETT